MLRWPTRREKLECLVTIAFIVAATVNVFIFISNPDVVFGAIAFIIAFIVAATVNVFIFISNPDVVFGAIATVITMMFWAWVLEGRLGPFLD